MHQGRALHTMTISEYLEHILFQESLFQESLFKTRNTTRLADSRRNSSKLQFAALQIQRISLECVAGDRNNN